MLAAPAMARRSYTVRVPAFEVPAGHNREICVYVPLPAKKAVDIGEVRMLNRGGTPSFATHHLIVYAYHGSEESVAGIKGVVFDDTACLNFASGKPSDLQIVATSQGPETRWLTPPGTALELKPDSDKKVIGLVLNSHWINGDSVPHKARAKIIFVTRKAKEVKRELKPIFEVVANGFIDVPPGQTREVHWTWGPNRLNIGGFLGGSNYPLGPACVSMLTSHMHKRGKLFTTYLVDTAGNKKQLYANTQYSDPPARAFTPPMLVTPGELLEYHCMHDNATSPKLGCEEQPGQAPGQSVSTLILEYGDFTHLDGAAKNCTRQGPNPDECPATDPKYPDRTFTGNCVPANLVFGFTSEDDMCILPGYYYDADPSAAPGQECTL
jgi:hypothetical protein